MGSRACYTSSPLDTAQLAMGVFGKAFARLSSTEDMRVDEWRAANGECVEERTVVLDKAHGDVGITLSNTACQTGCVICGLERTGLAAAAGLRVGDILLRVGEHRVGTHQEAVGLIDRCSTTIRLVVVAGNQAA